MPRSALQMLLVVLLVALFAGVNVGQTAPAAAPESSDAASAPEAGDAEGSAERITEPSGMRPRRVRDLRPLTDDELREAMEILKEINPALAQRITEWQERSPEKISMLLGSQLPRLRQFLEVRQRDPEMFELMVDDVKLERRSVRLARAMRDSSDEVQRQELGDALRATVNRHFEVRQTMRRRDLARLERRLEDLRGQLQQRQAARDELIRKRLDDLAASEPQKPRW